MKNNAIQQSFASMATLGNCKKRQRKTNRRKNLNISANSSPLKASGGTLVAMQKQNA